MVVDYKGVGPAEAGSLDLRVGYLEAPDAREVGRIIERLANAFEQEMRSREVRSPRLEIKSLQLGSLIVDLKPVFEMGSAVGTLLEGRSLLIDFVGRIAGVISALQQANALRVPAALRTFLDALARPVADGRANAAKLSVHGDNNTIIYIDHAGAIELDRLLAPLRPDRSGGGFGRLYPAERISPDDGPVAHMQDTADIDQSFRESLDMPVVSVEEIGATLLAVNGQWYARPQGLGGALLPATFPPDSISSDGQMDLAKTYNGVGQITYAGQSPTGFSVRTWAENPGFRR